MRDLRLAPPGDGTGPAVRLDASLRDALSALLASGAAGARVLDGGDNTVGTLTVDHFREALS